MLDSQFLNKWAMKDIITKNIRLVDPEKSAFTKIKNNNKVLYINMDTNDIHLTY